MGVALIRPTSDDGQALIFGGLNPLSVGNTHIHRLVTLWQYSGVDDHILKHLSVGKDLDGVSLLQAIEIAEDLAIDIVMAIQDRVARRAQASGSLMPADG